MNEVLDHRMNSEFDVTSPVRWIFIDNTTRAFHERRLKEDETSARAQTHMTDFAFACAPSAAFVCFYLRRLFSAPPRWLVCYRLYAHEAALILFSIGARAYGEWGCCVGSGCGLSRWMLPRGGDVDFAHFPPWMRWKRHFSHVTGGNLPGPIGAVAGWKWEQ